VKTLANGLSETRVFFEKVSLAIFKHVKHFLRYFLCGLLDCDLAFIAIRHLQNSDSIIRMTQARKQHFGWCGGGRAAAMSTTSCANTCAALGARVRMSSLCHASIAS
jgi:hypothetical protein